jgi:hypothetical protein
MSGRIPVKIVNPGEGSQPAKNFVPGSCKLWQPGDSQPVPMRQEDFAVAAGSPGVAALSPAAWFQWNQGVSVSQWDDKSGNGRHLKQATQTNQPALQPDGSLLFDGVDNFMKCDAFTFNQPLSIYVLAKVLSWTANDRLFDGSANDSVTMAHSTSSPSMRLNAGASLGLISPVLGAYAVIGAIANGATSSNFVNLSTPATGNAGAQNAAGFTLAARASGEVPMNVEIREVILFASAHDAVTRETVVSYLMRLM